VTGPRYNTFSPTASLRSLFDFSIKGIYGAYERPPYPIIIDTPTLRDVVTSWTVGDFVMGSTIYGTGVLWSYIISRPFNQLMQRLIVYHGISHLFFFTAATLMITLPYRRLTGYADNGLRWRNPEDKLRKYDSTSQFEKLTVWGRLSRRD
jgi:hypothetical protein